MGLEHLIAALGADLYIRHQEKKEQERLRRETAREFQAQIDRELEAEAYISQKGYNIVRQNKLSQMAQSILPEDRSEFAKILGRPYGKDDAALERALRAIAGKEGWLYYDENELIFDSHYCTLLGWTAPPPDITRRHLTRLAEMQKNEYIWQKWAALYPDCFVVDISPEFYRNEEIFAHIVQYEMKRKANK